MGLHEGRWQEVVGSFPDASLDAIFFDTWDETYVDLREFMGHVPRLLRPGGRFSFFNGLAPYNIMFHAVYCRMAQEDLLDLGLVCDFLPFEIGDLGDRTWQGVAQKYWQFETYYLPLATMKLNVDVEQPTTECENKECGWRRWPSIPVRIDDKVGESHISVPGDSSAEETLET